MAELWLPLKTEELIAAALLDGDVEVEVLDGIVGAELVVLDGEVEVEVLDGIVEAELVVLDGEVEVVVEVFDREVEVEAEVLDGAAAGLLLMNRVSADEVLQQKEQGWEAKVSK